MIKFIAEFVQKRTIYVLTKHEIIEKKKLDSGRTARIWKEKIETK